jgi:hypothetical protein
MAIVTVLSIATALAVLRVLWWWFVGRNVPKYPPLAVDDDNPAMLAEDLRGCGPPSRLRRFGATDFARARRGVEKERLASGQPRRSAPRSGERSLARPARLELATSWFVARRSIQLS